MWNKRVCVGSLENLDLGKWEVENTPGKVTEGQIEGSRWIVGRRGKVFMDWNFQNDKVECKVRLIHRFAAEEISSKWEEQERRRRTTYWRVSSPITKMAPACRASGKGRDSGKKVYTSHENGKPGNRMKEGERWKGYENNKNWNIKWRECWSIRDDTETRKQRNGTIQISKGEAGKQAKWKLGIWQLVYITRVK